jgi:hypothetical protein
MSKNLRSALWLVVGLTVALTTLSFAQEKVTLPKYDTAKEVHLKVTIQDIKEVPVSNGTRVVLNVKSGEDLLDVYLSPKDYLDMIEADLAKGDSIDLTGSKVMLNDKPIIEAREIVRGQNTIVLRDDKGAPAWTWMEKTKPAEGK